jgi:hypothetical protein
MCRRVLRCWLQQDNQGHLPKLVAHMENTSVAEALAHLLGADDLSATFMAPGDLAWLADTRVLQVAGPDHGYLARRGSNFSGMHTAGHIVGSCNTAYCAAWPLSRSKQLSSV